MNDDLRAVREGGPRPVQGWADSDEGRAVLATVLARVRTERAEQSASRRPGRRRFWVGAGVLSAGLVAGTGAAVAGWLPFSQDDPSHGMCARTLSEEAELSEPPTPFDPADPARACEQGWEEMWGGDATPRPERFATCRFPGGGGSTVFPADGYSDPAAACAAIGADPVPLPGS